MVNLWYIRSKYMVHLWFLLCVSFNLSEALLLHYWYIIDVIGESLSKDTDNSTPQEIIRKSFLVRKSLSLAQYSKLC